MSRSIAVLLLGLPLLLGAAALPNSGPVPQPKPGEETPSETQPQPQTEQADPAKQPAADIPTPEPKPEPQEGEEGKPEDGVPAGAKEATERKEGEAQTPEEAAAPPPPPEPPVEKEDPEALKACLADLAALGTKFKTADRIDEGEGCGIDQPLAVAEAVPGIDTGGALMRCETARALGHWLKDTVGPTLEVAMPDRKITGIVTGSTYACRLRNSASEGKISEHARGNAIDIAAFRLDDGSQISMKPRDEDGTMEGAFQRTVSAGACLYFRTVLAPGSDATHEDHLHLDILERTSEYRYCR